MIFKPDYITESRVIRILNLYFPARTLYWENITSEFCKLRIFVNFSKLISVFELEFSSYLGAFFLFFSHRISFYEDLKASLIHFKKFSVFSWNINVCGV